MDKNGAGPRYAAERNMMFGSIRKKIEKIIDGLPDGAVFVPTDFSDVAAPATASKTLVRLHSSGSVGKLMRGVFWKGRNREPAPDEVARALARSNNWQAAPCGDTALHVAGFSISIPQVWTYITDGTYRVYKYGKTVIEFRHASGKFLAKMSDKTATLIQVIKAFGKEKMTDEFLRNIASKFKKEEILQFFSESCNTTDWIHSAIGRMLTLKEGA